jgi:hypothetical protein
MSDHAWVVEQVASYLAGGLEPAEVERLENHTAECGICAQVLAEARRLDQTMETLFAEVRPGPALEDRMVRSLRGVPRPRRPRLAWIARLAASVAAVVVLALVGMLMNHLIGQGQLPILAFGDAERARSLAQNDLKQLELVLASKQRARPDLSPIEQQPIIRTPEALDALDANRLAESIRDDFSYKVNMNRIADGSVNFVDQSHSMVAGETTASNKTGNVPAPSVANPLSAHGAATQTYAPPTVLTATPGFGMQSGLSPYGTIVSSTPATQAPKGESPGAAPANDYFRPGALATAPPPGTSIGQGRELKARPEQTKSEGDKKQKDGEAPKPGAPAADPVPPSAPRKIIRSGDIEFEIESFDAAVAAITKLVSDPKMGGFIATVNSEKLPNGKVRGSVAVRVPPEHLDPLLLDLRKELGKGGELKSQRIGSQDITKQYTDLESRLRAARAMEERLLQIIKTGKGEIKDLLLAEKELGIWRTKIEELEGELRYYANLVALSTLTITLTEKEIRAPFAILETEQVKVNIEVEDVEKAQREALAAVAGVNGRVVKSELKKDNAGQYSAVLHAEVAADKAIPLRDRLKGLGRVTRLDVDRLQQAEGGTARAGEVIKVKRGDVRFEVILYDLATVQPREWVSLSLACPDADAAYKTILNRVEKAAGRVVKSDLKRQPNEKTVGTIQFDVKAAEADAVLAAIKEVGEVMALQTTEASDTAPNVTRAKRGFQVNLLALGAVVPRQTLEIQLATHDVPAGFRTLQEAVAKAKGRVLVANLNEQEKQNISAQFEFTIRRGEEAAIQTALAAAGEIYARKATRAADGDNVLDSLILVKVALINPSNIQPRETVTLGIEVADVDQAAAAMTAYVVQVKGRAEQARMSHEPNGRVTAKLIFDVPLVAAAGVVEKCKATGTVRAQQSTHNPQVPESALAIARLEVTLSNTDLIVPSDEGIWAQVRKGLKTSFVAISWSLIVVIIGVCAVLPWVLVILGVYVVVRRLRRKPAAATP